MQRKHWFSLFFAVILAVAVMGMGNVQASAATHSHPICGSTCRCSSSSHSKYTWQAWDGTTKMYNGNYYLTKDVVLSNTIILDYSYTSCLCLNGYSITCEDTVFDIYSYRSLLITDCKGTGKIETTGENCTIGNNKNLTIWGGTIVNSCTGAHFSAAINAYPNTNTTICGGRVECEDSDTIYASPGCKIHIMGGTVHGGGKYGSAISGNGSSGTNGSVTISGGRITQDQNWETALDIQDGSFVMTGGYVDGNVDVYDEEGTTTVSGGTINGQLYVSSGSTSITGGDMNLYLSGYGNPATVSGGTFRGSCTLWGPNITVTGGDFSQCTSVQTPDEVWICGGSYSVVQALSKPLYLSGVPDIASLQIYKPGTVSAQSKDGTGSFGGETVPVSLCYPYDSYAWKDGDIVIKNVKSNAVAQKFQLTGDDTQFMHLERSGNNLVLRILPHGTWGSNATWVLQDGILTISGTGALQETHSGTQYPWGQYTSQIKTIVVEDGITDIPRYLFEYCEQATTIRLPNTLAALSLHAFQDCGSLNNLLLPASLTSISGTSNTLRPSFIRCESLMDLYYLGTEEAWASVTNANRITSSDSNMTIHFLQLQESTATCTEPGKQAYYRFDDTSVYSGMYDADYQSITVLQTVPALGHDYIDHEAKEPTNNSVGWDAYQTCSRCDYSTYKEIPATALASGTCGDNLTWVLSQDGTLTISGTGPMWNFSGTSAQPWQNKRSSIQKVVIEPGATTIGQAAFGACSNITSATIPEGVTAIGYGAFSGCSSLTSVTVPESVVSIGDGAFSGTNLVSITIPKGLTVVSRGLFMNCDSLISITIPDNITSIGDDAFHNCSSLSSIDIPDSVVSIGKYAFSDCSNLTAVTMGDSVTSIGTYAFLNCSNLSTVTIGNSVTTIDTYAFYNCGLTSVVIPGSVATIARGAFNHCDSLISITIGENISVIGAYAFYDCNSLTTVFYRGTESQRHEIHIQDWNEELTGADWHYSVVDAVLEGKECYYCPDCDGYFLPNGEELRQKATVTFLDEDGTVLSEKIYYRGDAVTPPAAPTKTADNTYTYTFAGWDKPVTSCTGDTTYTATYTSTYIDYTVAFVDWNEEILCVRTCHWGDAVIVPSDPVRVADNMYAYTFAGWNKVITNCTGNATYTATYTQRYIDYTITFADEDGTVLSEGTYHWGEEVIIPDDPAKSADETYTYSFTGWDKDVVNCAGNAIYVAVYKPAYIEYTVTFRYADGTTIDVQILHYGDAVEIPKDPEAPEAHLVFAGWDQEITDCEGDAEYIALFAPSYLPGDMDDSGEVTVEDALYLLKSILMPDLFPIEQEADFDDNGMIDEDDAIYLLQHVLMPDYFPL